MATFNGEQHLSQQLESIAAQTRLPDELVIFDDASEDDTLEIADAFAKKSPFPVRIHVNSQQVGARENFTRALLSCVGDLVFICDQDDVWLPNKIERTCQLFAESPEAVGVSVDARICDAELHDSGVTVFATAGPGNGACNAYRSDFLRFALPVPPSPTSYDGWLYRLSTWMNARRDAPDILRLWRRHGTALSGWKNIGPSAKPIQRSRLYWLPRRLPRLRAADRTRLLSKDLLNLHTMIPRVDNWLANNSSGVPLYASVRSLESTLPVLVEITEARRVALQVSRIKRLAITVRLLRSESSHEYYVLRDAVIDMLTSN